jgi:LPS export ABC transporter protein LptC
MTRPRWTCRLLVVTALLLVAAPGCKRSAAPVPSGSEAWRGLPDQESWNSTVSFSDSGVLRAILTAAHISRFDARQETLIDSGLVVDFYTKNGDHGSRLTARRGRVNDATKDLEAFENVVFRSDSGTVVTTEYLFWDATQKKVRSDKFVRVVSPKEQLEGFGFEADQNLKNYVIFRVSGQAELVKEK